MAIISPDWFAMQTTPERDTSNFFIFAQCSDDEMLSHRISTDKISS